ncbi:MAG: hypothetical protein ACUVSG_09245 [Anaerolineae bacterium]
MRVLLTGAFGNVGQSAMVAVLGFRRHLIRAFRPLVRWWLLRQSPYWRQRREEARRARRARPIRKPSLAQ